MSNKNQYEKDSRKKSLLGTITETQETKGDIKGTAVETGKDLIVGVIGGGIVGALIGKASLLVGAAVTGIGHYTKNSLARIFGVGMMAANGFQPKKEGVSGTEENKDMLEGAKDRVMAFKDSFSEKLFLDKVLKKKEQNSEQTTNGVGEVQYFTYPEQNQVGVGDVDMSALDRLEQQVANSAESFRQKNEVKGIPPDEEMMGETFDPTDKIL